MGRDEKPDWAESLGDVRPLQGRDEVQAPPGPGRAARPVRDGSAPQRVTFEIERTGEVLRGRAQGIDRKHLERLRRGRQPVEERVDLHGLDAAAAEHRLRETLLAAQAAGRRCVLVVHGRGLHSEADAVLKQALPEWLAAAPVGPLVMAFSSATPEDGGAGATYVLLRRAR